MSLRDNSPSNTVRSTVARARPIRPPPKEYDYKISGGGKDIVAFTLFANARHSKDAPTLVGRDPVAGTVRLRLEKPTTVKSITITICGRCLPTVGFYVDTNSFSDENTFMEISHKLWSAEQDGRRADMISGGVTRDGKLQGEYLWSYAIEIPPTLTAPTPAGEVSFVPPQTFKEQYCAMVVYDVLLRIKRKWPLPDYKIEAPFVYVPAISPSGFPGLRRLAYAQGTPLPSPHIDPDGWHAFGDIQLTGTLFKSRPLDVECTLFLAKPLQYTRGTEIPLYMRISSHNSQAVDILSSEVTTAIAVRLQRRIKLSALTKSRNKLSSMALDTGSRVQESLGARAVWWPSTTAADLIFVSGRYVRYVRGELRLKDGLKPSSAMPYMKIDVSLFDPCCDMVE
ncbi:hypothetical protein HYPSUDRAFT_784216 [Hypholoma sublateritium FD-334 SS-4]|uniref:Arrestin-like N-terminal domain-containing protein n=1 Tax=Hypholoma sublateritium (strain FD-334 SS-4) TaxID=945553 RepID=A0A0D2PKK3_HYPSF|nr:hypothetical protein HYPSUDRAFT_784216 [Hypholoma sublateritium FD-334 SS-4]